jgi:hypothetical protein
MNPNEQQMQQQMGPPSKPHIPFYITTPLIQPIVLNDVLNPYQCDQLIEYFEENEELQEAGQTGTNTNIEDRTIANNAGVRNVSVIPVMNHLHNPEEKNDILREMVGGIQSTIDNVNETSYMFELDTLAQVELARYLGNDDIENSGKYDWHTDTGPVEAKTCRKLSFSIILNDDYDGGELGFFMGADSEPAKLPAGTMVIFPSFLAHKVFPVTSGTRYSMFGWVHGPRFK